MAAAATLCFVVAAILLQPGAETSAEETTELAPAAATGDVDSSRVAEGGRNAAATHVVTRMPPMMVPLYESRTPAELLALFGLPNRGSAFGASAARVAFDAAWAIATDPIKAPCLAPVVCQQQWANGSTSVGIDAPQGCVAAGVGSTQPQCDWRLPPLDPTIAARATSAIIEVGTNKQPESSMLSRLAPPGRYIVAVEPLRKEGRHLWQNRFADVLVSAAAATERGTAYFEVDGVASRQQPAGRPTTLAPNATTAPPPAAATTASRLLADGSLPRLAVPLLPLSDVIAALVPPAVRLELLIVDAQGFDQFVVESAGETQLARAELVVVECEQLHRRHPSRLIKDAPLCSTIAAKLQQRFTFLKFVGCVRNVGSFEYNCLFAQRRPPVATAKANATSATQPPLGDSQDQQQQGEEIRTSSNGTTTNEAVGDGTAEEDTFADESVFSAPDFPPLPPFTPAQGARVATFGLAPERFPPLVVQLAQIFASPRRALELSYVLCPMLLNLPARSHVLCRLHTIASLREQPRLRGACARWRRVPCSRLA